MVLENSFKGLQADTANLNKENKLLKLDKEDLQEALGKLRQLYLITEEQYQEALKDKGYNLFEVIGISAGVSALAILITLILK